jgi:thiamine biosynthesis lipoprotein ApbE
VWVQAPDPAEADALSTALFVMGPEGARRYCEEHPLVAAYLLVENTEMSRDPAQRFRGVDLGLGAEMEGEFGE